MKFNVDITLAKTGSGFRWIHGKQYQKLQRKFFNAAQLGSPEALNDILAENPFHPDSCLILSDIATYSGQHATCLELLERALYTFEKCFSSEFRILLKGDVLKLKTLEPLFPYRYYENRTFHVLIFKYIQALLRKGARKTGLEWAKFLYLLDPSDPLGITYQLDYLCKIVNEDFFGSDSAYEIYSRTYSEDFGPDTDGLWPPQYYFSSALAHKDSPSYDTLIEIATARYPLNVKGFQLCQRQLYFERMGQFFEGYHGNEGISLPSKDVIFYLRLARHLILCDSKTKFPYSFGNLPIVTYDLYPPKDSEYGPYEDYFFDWLEYYDGQSVFQKLGTNIRNFFLS